MYGPPFILGECMPTYSMKNVDTDEEFEVTLKIAERETYLQDNLNIKQIFNKFPGIVDSVRIGVRKPDNAFKDVLSKAKNAHKRSTIDY
jgi:hypothetical protein